MSDRDQFIQDLIAALEDNDASLQAQNTPNASSVSPPDDGQEITGLFLPPVAQARANDLDNADIAYNCLQFDFPQLQPHQAQALVHVYQSMLVDTTVEESDRVEQAKRYSVTSTMVQGLSYLNDKERGSEQTSMLAALVLLSSVHYALQNPHAPITTALFAKLSIPVDAPTDMINNDDIVHGNEPTVIEEEKLAEDEDPDDLSLVYEGSLQPSTHQTGVSISPEGLPSASTLHEKLLFLSQHTYSSAFSSLSLQKWQEYDLTSVLHHTIRQVRTSDSDLAHAWTTYVYILRDRLLQHPSSTTSILPCLVDILHFVHSSPNDPTYVLYHVLLEISVSNEMQKAPRSSHDLATCIQNLLPDLLQDVQALSSLENQKGDWIHVVAHLCYSMLLLLPRPDKAVQILVNSGILRALLSHLPPEQSTDVPWLRRLLRLLSLCALCDVSFASYASRVPKMKALLPSIALVSSTDAALFALAFHQAHLSSSLHLLSETKGDAWSLLVSEDIYPPTCTSFADSKSKMDEALGMLQTLEKAATVLEPSVQQELRQTLQKHLHDMTKAFEWAPSSLEEEDSEKSRERVESEREQMERQRDNLRRATKKLLLLTDTKGPQVGLSKLD